MPSYRFVEIPFSNQELDQFSNEDGLYGINSRYYRRIPSYIDVLELLQTARKICTKRQFEVFELIVQGYTQAEVGRRLGISRGAVARHFMYIKKKFRKYYKTQ